MCIAATVNGSETTYVLSATGATKFGWMAIGFGAQMANSPMVITWVNNGNMILSQRQASGQVEPTVVSSPPRVATALQAQTTISSTKPVLAFTVPSNSDTTQDIIYAFGSNDPGSADPAANLVQHLAYGPLQLNLAKAISSSSNGTSGSGTSGTGTATPSLSLPLLPYQKMIVAHAIFCAVGFLLLLPGGVLLVRYLRTFIGTWFKGHWIVQFGIAGVVIVIGVGLGVVAVHKAEAPHFDDDHKRWGIALFVLYIVQCGLGAFIHFVKKVDRKRRPPQNYLHAILGLAIIGLALYQVHSGYDEEWTETTGRDPVPSYVNIIFWVWTALLAASYTIGLAFLPKQFRQERTKTTYQYQKASQ
ncbi:CBD9-like protein [Pholiota conissans]|uniref:CBD9-like protein n=1 Tax=Pholiota conissans TaxID=109636 RepID=A0A9P5Z013_9AGAR|nr:CBD9-like protein [Pholiota conissans]